MVKVPPDGSLGPAMLALTPSQRAFVIALISTSGTNKGYAAALAGYGGDGNDKSQQVAGCRLAAHPKVIAAVKEEADKRMCAGAALAANVILEIAMDPMHKDRLKAAEMLKNQAGLIVAQRIDHTVTLVDDRSVQEIQEQTLALAKRLGVELPQLSAPVIDAEFEEVGISDEDTEDRMGSLEGLEDLF